MTPKEKAKELLDRFEEESICIFYDGSTEKSMTKAAKQCALICVDELIMCLPSINGRPPNYQFINEYVSEYWEEVKQEIEKL
tara:strand:+ start:454 stop:699 length:246 start_codon:yes stop_codon:yes gene_type:complete